MSDQDILDRLDFDTCGCGTAAVYRFDTVCPRCRQTDHGHMCHEHALNAMRAVYMCDRCRFIASFELFAKARTQIGEPS